MVRLVLLLSLLFLSGENLILWAPDYQVVPEDFMAKPDMGVPYHAKTYCRIAQVVKVSSSGERLFEVQCLFDKGKSWIRKDKITRELLDHEQLHFDLTEVYARELKMRLSLSRPDKGQEDQTFRTILDEVMKDLGTATQRYDEETNHGMDRENQEIWNSAIRSRLQE